MVIIYHRMDLDGFTSGAIAKRKYPDAKLIGYHYEDPFDFDQIEDGEGAIILDVSFTPEQMEKIADKAGELIWVDHHKTAIDSILRVFPMVTRKVDSVNGIDVHEIHFRVGKLTSYTKIGIAACEIASLVLFPDEDLTIPVRLLGEYDTWRKDDQEKWDKHIMPFQYGMRELVTSPADFPEHFLTGQVAMLDVDDVIEKGNTILSYQEKMNAAAMRASFEAFIKGKLAICCNIGGANSNAFKSVFKKDRHDLIVPFVYTGSHFKMSFFTENPDIDCSAIAKSVNPNGGGHVGAAGCQLSLEEITNLFNAPIFK